MVEQAEIERLKIGELFAGYGGLGMGVQAALGGEISWVSEYDPGPSKILAHRFPGVPNHGDITSIDWSSVEPVDVITGGSPCQDLSAAGKRAGMTEGTRSNLWVAMREAIARLRPSLVVWENVRGAYSAAAASAVEPCPGCVGDGSAVSLRALGRVLGDLSDLGYDASWHGLPAADVGAPHGRFRVFVAAADAERGGWNGRSLDSLRRPLRRAPLAGGSQGARLLPTPRAGDGDKGGPNQRGSSGDLMLPSAVAQLLPTPTVQDAANTGGPSQLDRNSIPLNAVVTLLPTPSGMNAANDPGSVESWVARRDRMLELGINGNGIGTPLGIAIHLDWGQYAEAIARWEALTRAAPAPTEVGPRGAQRLSPALSEWMMGLPAGWVTDVPGITRNEALKALGNGVVPQQAAAALRFMLASEVAA